MDRLVDSLKYNCKPENSERRLKVIDSLFKGQTGSVAQINKIQRLWLREHFLPQEQCFAVLDSAVALSDPEVYGTDYSDCYVNSLIKKGNLLLKVRRLRESYAQYFRAKIAAETYGLDYLKHEYYASLAHISYMQHDFDQSAHYYKEGIKAGGGMGKPAQFRQFGLVQGMLDNIGICYSNIMQTDSAEKYYLTAIRYINLYRNFYPEHKHDIDNCISVVYGNLGGLHFKKGNLAEAERYLEMERSYCYPNGPVGEGGYNTYVTFARIFTRTGRLHAADSVLAQCADSLRRHKDLKSLTGLWQARWEYYKEIDDDKMAYLALSRYTKLKEEAQNNALAANFESVGRIIEEIEKQHSVELDVRDNGIKNLWLVIAVSASVLLAAFLLLLWKYLNQSRKNVHRLYGLNETIGKKNAEMHRTLSALKQSQQDNERILKMVVHDLRNPIGSVQTALQMLKEDEQLSTDSLELLELAEKAAENSMELIQELLITNAAVGNLTKAPVDIAGVVQYCIDMLRFKADEKGQSLIFANLPAFMVADKEKLWRVFSNLISNAIKFSNQGAEIEMGITKKPESVLVWVMDHGIGIPENLKPHVFDIFTDAKRRGTSGEHTYGLGLSICKEIVEAHQGRIWFESEAGSGTTFFVELPL